MNEGNERRPAPDWGTLVGKYAVNGTTVYIVLGEPSPGIFVVDACLPIRSDNEIVDFQPSGRPRLWTTSSGLTDAPWLRAVWCSSVEDAVHRRQTAQEMEDQLSEDFEGLQDRIEDQRSGQSGGES